MDAIGISIRNRKIAGLGRATAKQDSIEIGLQLLGFDIHTNIDTGSEFDSFGGHLIDAALDGAEVIYNLGADEIDMPDGAFVIYQGSHGDRGAHRADVILPGAAWTEESGVFVNTEGRPQRAIRAGFPPGDAKENWSILRALSAETGAVLPFNSLAELRAAMVAEVPHLGRMDEVPENAWTPVALGSMTRAEFGIGGTDHYRTNPIARASQVMAELAGLAKDRARPLAAE